jgi:hypothetical protein
MLKFVQTARMNDLKLPSLAFCGSVALLALVSATPAGAQGVPAGLLRLDPPVASNYGRPLAEFDRAPVRTRHAFARDRQSRHQKLVRRPE